MKRIIYPTLLIILSFWAIKPLFHSGFFPMHDDQQIARLFELDKSLKAFQIPPRWVPDLGFGFGYPLYNFYPPLVYYLGEFFHLLNISLIASTKIVMGLGFILSAVSMFFLAKKYVASSLALLASILYLYAPYRSLDVYVRGALAESFTFVFYPLILLGLFNTLEKSNLKNFLLLSLSFTALILTHSLMVFPFSIFLGLIFLVVMLYDITTKRNPKGLLWPLAAFIYGFIITSYFSLPSILEKKFTLVDEILTRELASYQLHFIYLRQFWNSPWGYGGSLYGLLDGISFEIGKIHLILLLLSVVSVIYLNIKKRKIIFDKFLILNSLFLILSIYLASFHSAWLWNMAKPLWYIQFPWRFISFSILFLPLIIALLIHGLSLPKKLNTV